MKITMFFLLFLLSFKAFTQTRLETQDLDERAYCELSFWEARNNVPDYPLRYWFLFDDYRHYTGYWVKTWEDCFAQAVKFAQGVDATTQAGYPTYVAWTFDDGNFLLPDPWGYVTRYTPLSPAAKGSQLIDGQGRTFNHW